MKEIIFPEKKEIKGPPSIKKNGIIYPCGSEMSVFVHNGRLKYLVNHWQDFANNIGTATVGDYETRKECKPFGGESGFYSMYYENGTTYAFGTNKNNVWLYTSKDLENWTEGKIVLTFPENFKLFNTAVCKGSDGYVIAVECGYANDENGKNMPNEYIGSGFTEFFAKSEDLENWELFPFENAYTPQRYNACPAMEFCDGYYYMICLEELPSLRYAPYIYRTKDFETWEIGFYNPLFVPSLEDLSPKKGVEIPQEMLDECFCHLNTNNSDIDLCEFEGKTYIFYCNGNQGNTWGGLYCEAIYDGPLAEFLKRNFE